MAKEIKLDFEEFREAPDGAWMLWLLARRAREYFEDPENLRKFEAWKKKKTAAAMPGADGGQI